MLFTGVIFPGQGTDAAVFGVLLTIESLLLTVSGLLLTIAASQTSARDVWITPRLVGRCIAVFMCVVAFAAVEMWIGVFDRPWPSGFMGRAVALVVLSAVVLEALLALAVAFPLNRRARAAPQ